MRAFESDCVYVCATDAVSFRFVSSVVFRWLGFLIQHVWFFGYGSWLIGPMLLRLQALEDELYSNSEDQYDDIEMQLAEIHTAQASVNQRPGLRAPRLVGIRCAA